MKKYTRSLIRICIVLASLNLAWLGYITIMYLGIPKVFVLPDIYLNLITIGILVMLISHLIIIASTILSLKHSQSMSVAGMVLLILGVISLIALLVYFVAYDQLYEDFEYNDPYGNMLKLAWMSESVLILFFLYALIYFFTLNRYSHKYDSTNSVFRERTFVALNFTGIACGIVGMLLVWFDFKLLDDIDVNISRLHPLRTIDLAPFILIFLPYLSVLGGWGISCFRDRRSGWYDEKQRADMNRSGMVALLGSIPLIIALILFGFLNTSATGKVYISGSISVLWLVFYFFMVMLLFSTVTLYNFKKN